MTVLLGCDVFSEIYVLLLNIVFQLIQCLWTSDWYSEYADLLGSFINGKLLWNMQTFLAVSLMANYNDFKGLFLLLKLCVALLDIVLHLVDESAIVTNLLSISDFQRPKACNMNLLQSTSSCYWVQELLVYVISLKMPFIED